LIKKKNPFVNIHTHTLFVCAYLQLISSSGEQIKGKNTVYMNKFKNTAKTPRPHYTAMCSLIR